MRLSNLHCLGEDIRQYRKDADLSLREASKQCGIHFTTLSRIELNQSPPTLEHFALLCDWLEVSPDIYLQVSR